MAKISPQWPLRAGCAFVNLYAGFFLITDPSRYYKYVPGWLSAAVDSVASVDTYLRAQGVGEIAIAIVLLGWFFPARIVRLAAVTLAVEMILIVVFIGVDSVTFRNVGLLGAALSIVLTTFGEAESHRPEEPASTEPAFKQAVPPASRIA